MKIFLLGATGRVGSHILKQIIEDGHEVNALVRSLDKVDIKSDRLTVFEGDVLNKYEVAEAIVGCDHVISGLSTDGAAVLSNSMPIIISAMVEHDIKRIVTVGTAGILQSRVNPAVYRYQSSETKRKSPKSVMAADDHRKAFECISQSNLDWTVVCPTYLPDGDEKGFYRVEKTFLPVNGERIHVPDVAKFTYQQLFVNNYIKHRVGLAY